MLKLILKIFGYCSFEYKKKYITAISNHSIKRAEKRITLPHLLRIVAENAIEYGDRSVHFEYYVNDKNKKYNTDGQFARKYKGYIWVFDKNNKLLTVYNISNIADLLISRK